MCSEDVLPSNVVNCMAGEGSGNGRLSASAIGTGRGVVAGIEAWI